MSDYLKPPRRKMDWLGLTVVGVFNFQNRLGTIPAGTKYVVEYISVKGADIKSFPCGCCGMQFSVKVDTSLLKILDTPENRDKINKNELRPFKK